MLKSNLNNMAYAGEKREQQAVALERIRLLFELAGKEALDGETGLAAKHVSLARSIGTRFNVRMPREFKGKYCKGCSSYFTSKNSKTRLNSESKKVEVKCAGCGEVMEFSYK